MNEEIILGDTHAHSIDIRQTIKALVQWVPQGKIEGDWKRAAV